MALPDPDPVLQGASTDELILLLLSLVREHQREEPQERRTGVILRLFEEPSAPQVDVLGLMVSAKTLLVPV